MNSKYFPQESKEQALEEFKQYLSIRQVWLIKSSSQDFIVTLDDKNRISVRFVWDEKVN